VPSAPRLRLTLHILPAPKHSIASTPSLNIIPLSFRQVKGLAESLFYLKNLDSYISIIYTVGEPGALRGRRP